MLRSVGTALFLGVMVMAVVPARATILTLPFIGDIEHPDMDPFHILAPAPAAEPAPEPAKPMKKHRHHKKM